MFTAQDHNSSSSSSRGRVPAEAVIAEGVLARLGEPAGLHTVQVRPVYGDKYRVNVYVRAGAGSYRVAHSFLVSADAGGLLTASSPPIARLY